MHDEEFKDLLHALGYNIHNLPKVGRRRLKFKWTKEFGEDLKKISNDIENGILDMLEKEIKQHRFSEYFELWQKSGYIHPFTCGNDSNHLLVYRNDQLECPLCNYVQKLTPRIRDLVMKFGEMNLWQFEKNLNN